MASFAPEGNDTGFTVWGVDQTAYGPVELPVLVDWIKDERVSADTWIYQGATGAWRKASEMPELQMFFRSATPRSSAPLTAENPRGVEPRALRRIRILGGMSDEQLARFAAFVEVQKVPQWSVVVQQGDPGDAMYFVLEGELRVRINILGKETILATLSAGEMFGDIALFDRGPRSADVVANADSVLAKVTSAGFDTLEREAPDLAAKLLHAIGKTLTARIRADNKRYGDSVKFARAAT